ncbi:MAG: hypothetical protein B6U97_00135 [Candidatus Altiarchaeales archaeon ex4484_96]|nr:MAG: hypothetical protein B6U97_00135 [Candidatus Altiarchaeales archaeon ex4484_96]
MVTVLNIGDLFKGVGWALRDLFMLLNPFRWDDFFLDMRLQEPKINPLSLWALLSVFSVMVLPSIFREQFMLVNAVILFILVFTLWLGNYIMDFFLLSGYFTYIGYFVSGIYGTMDSMTATKVGFLYFFIGVFFVCLISYALVLLNRQNLRWAESFPLAVYSAIPGLLGGIFVAYAETIVLSFLFIAYSIILFYVGVKTRLGFDRAFSTLVVSVFLSGGLSMVLLRVLALLLGVPEWAF